VTVTVEEVALKAQERLGVDAVAWALLQETTRTVILRACLGKVPMGLHAAKSVERVHRAEGERQTAYRCPFSPPDAHWHIGHVPSIETVATIALAVRDLHGNLPNPG